MRMLLLLGSLWLLIPMAAVDGGSCLVMEEEFTPLGSTSVFLAALGSQAQLAQNWLEEKDFLSADEAAGGLVLLVRLAALQSRDPKWSRQMTALEKEATNLQKSAARKNAASCQQGMDRIRALLEEGRLIPAESAASARPQFAPFGSNRAWMKLMDGAYVDAKTAQTPEEMQNLASLMSEEANVVAYLRTDARWRTMSREVRDAARQAATQAKQGDLVSARQTLKKAHARCEACHHGYKR